jgi:hypothetical protein
VLCEQKETSIATWNVSYQDTFPRRKQNLLYKHRTLFSYYPYKLRDAFSAFHQFYRVSVQKVVVPSLLTVKNRLRVGNTSTCALKYSIWVSRSSSLRSILRISFWTSETHEAEEDAEEEAATGEATGAEAGAERTLLVFLLAFLGPAEETTTSRTSSTLAPSGSREAEGGERWKSPWLLIKYMLHIYFFFLRF